MLATIGNFVSRLWDSDSSARMSSTSSAEAEAQAKKFEGRRLIDGVYQLFPDSNSEQETHKANVEIVLFPGLQLSSSDPAQSHWRTWKMRETEDCWLETLLPKLLVDKGSGRQYRARVLSVSYESRADLGEDGKSKGTGSSDHYLLVESLIAKLIYRSSVNVGQNGGVPVFLVGHDLGGILIKLFVMKVEEAEADETQDLTRKMKLHKFLENLKSVFFYATPHSGAPILDRLVENIPSDTRNEMLRFLKVLNADKQRLNQAFHNYRTESLKLSASLRLSKFSTHAIHANHHTYLEALNGTYMVVPEGTERSGVDVFFSVDADHFQICQPEGKHSSSAQMLADEIMTVVQNQEASREKGASDTPQASQASNSEEIRKKRLVRFDPAGAEVLSTSTTQASAPRNQLR